MPSKDRDIGREIDAQEPSPELKRAVARDIEKNAGKRPIHSSQAGEIPDAESDTQADDEAPSHLQKPDNTSSLLNPDPEKLSTKIAQDDERPGS
jgi:hypothetical protein